jgi:hypothetical protein
MCGKKPKAPPPVVQRDPVAEQRKAEAEAQTSANAETAQRRRRRSWTSSMTQIASRAMSNGSGTNAPARSLLAQARPEG